MPPVICATEVLVRLPTPNLFQLSLDLSSANRSRILGLDTRLLEPQSKGFQRTKDLHLQQLCLQTLLLFLECETFLRIKLGAVQGASSGAQKEGAGVELTRRSHLDRRNEG